jgi:hypothetical protein
MNTIPIRTKALAKLWVMKFIATHPNWETDESYIDEWYAHGNYDLNLYCEDGHLSVCAYPMYMGDDGFMVTDHDEYEYLVKKVQS